METPAFFTSEAISSAETKILGAVERIKAAAKEVWEEKNVYKEKHIFSLAVLRCLH